MQKTPNSPSEFDELLQEARDAIEQDKYQKNSQRWTRTIWLLMALQLILILSHEAVLLLASGVMGAAVCAVLAALATLISFNKKWNWEWKFTRNFHVIYTIFLVGCLPVALAWPLRGLTL